VKPALSGCQLSAAGKNNERFEFESEYYERNADISVDIHDIYSDMINDALNARRGGHGHGPPMGVADPVKFVLEARGSQKKIG